MDLTFKFTPSNGREGLLTRVGSNLVWVKKISTCGILGAVLGVISECIEVIDFGPDTKELRSTSSTGNADRDVAMKSSSDDDSRCG
jgi:hypothetical protein